MGGDNLARLLTDVMHQVIPQAEIIASTVTQRYPGIVISAYSTGLPQNPPQPPQIASQNALQPPQPASQNAPQVQSQETSHQGGRVK